MNDKINILHLSDLHFGVETSPDIAPTAIAQRTNTLNSLIDEIAQLESAWEPNIVVISGDIGWLGKKKDYEQAAVWLNKLLAITNLTPNELILCAGNHDIDRDETISMRQPASPKEAYDWLKIETVEHFSRPFKEFSSFIRDFKIPLLSIAEKSYPLMGQRTILGVRFIVLNTAWFSRDREDKGKLWIGKPQLEVMKASSQLVDQNKYDDETITISVLHHPPADLHDAEYNTYDSQECTYLYLSKHSHLILSGHSHGAVDPPHKEFNHAYLFKGGSTYAGATYKNNFSLLQIDTQNRSVIRKSFEFNPGDGSWKCLDDPNQYELRLSPTVLIGQIPDAKSNYDYNNLSQKAKEAANRYIDQKAFALLRTDNIPEFIKRQVAVHNREERTEKNKNKDIHLHTKNNLAPLSDMVSVERPTFLFGELGSGKSTLVGQYVIELSEQVDGLIPLLIPAKFFQNKKYDTASELLQVISRYVNEQINPTADGFDLSAALRSKLEIILVIDGFDELDIELAQSLLSQLENIVAQWSGIRVIATGRPIELQGLNYSRWQCLEMLSLSDDEQLQLLYNEAIACKSTTEQAKSDAKTRLSFLKQNPELLSIATTPLTVRLLRPHLQGIGQKKTVGDLLYDVTLERLGGWGIKDQKDDHLPEFKQLFPDSLSREGLLGKIAWSIHVSPNKTITKETVYDLIQSEIREMPNKGAIASQGCEFLVRNILQQEGEEFSFPSMPLFQCALGIHILNVLHNHDGAQITNDDLKLWREYSFAVAIARRKSVIDKLRVPIQGYVDNLLVKKAIPAAALVVSESGDSALAMHFVNSLNGFEFRPLKYFDDFKSTSWASYAKCFYLAGKEGFNWFFKEYLDPRYPMPQHINYHVLILQHWLLLSEFSLSENQKKKLSTIPMPHLAARSWGAHNLLPTISTVLPELFDPIQRTLLLIECLSSTILRERAISFLKREYESGNKEAVLNALETACSNDQYGTATTEIRLWMELCHEKPPLSVIHAVIRASIKEEGAYLYEELAKRIGENNLRATLRWYVFQKDKMATASALLLHQFGENNLYVLGEGLLAGLHDGGKVAGAEEALLELVQREEEKGLLWLVNQFPHAGGISDGAHSAYWRIFLKEINRHEKFYVNWLRFTIRYLGEYNLPRYPDIRREFQLLLSAKPHYRNALYDALKSIDPYTRYNAACILLSCFPETESAAAEIVISATTQAYDRHEWIRFCMRLSLGKAVLDYIASKLDYFLPVPKTFVLVLLSHNGYPISDVQYRDMIYGLLKDSPFDHRASFKNEDDDLRQILAEDRAFGILTELLDNDTSLTAEAADTLWRHHRVKLTPEQYVTCWTFCVKNLSIWNLMELDSESERIINDKEFMDNATLAAQRNQKQDSKEPVTSIYLRSLSGDLSAWKDFLWSGIYCGFSFHEIEPALMWLFNKGSKNPKIKEALGKSALELLDDPRIATDKRYNDAMLWLVFIAHEFAELSNPRLEDTILHFKTIGHEITCALIARLGHVPKNFDPGDKRDYLTIYHKHVCIPVTKPTLEQLVEITRDNVEIHDEFCLYIEKTLLSDASSQDEIEKIAYKNRLGALFSIIVLFCRNSIIDNGLIIRTIGISLSKPYQPNNAAQLVDSSLKNIRKVIAAGANTNSYFTAIQDAIKKRKAENIIDLFKELLEHNVPVDENILLILLSEVSSHTYSVDKNLGFYLSDYIANQVDESKKPMILSEFKKAIRTIGSKIEKGVIEKHHSQRNVMCEWFFALSVFYLQNDVDEDSERVFLQGLQSAFIQKYEQHHTHSSVSLFYMRDVLNAVYPLLEKTPRWIIRKAIDDGIKSDVAEVGAICRLLLALVTDKR